MSNNYEKEMRVLKRNGQEQEVSFDKILQRVKKLGSEVVPPLAINYSQLIMKVIDQLYDKIPTYIIDELTAEQCAALSTKHIDYATLANRIIVSNNHKITINSFFSAMECLYNHRDVHDNHKPLIHPDIWAIVLNNKDVLDAMILYERDYLFDYFGFKTLERSYLMRIKGTLIERPQHMWLRVALGIHFNDLEAVKETYDLMSQKYFTHATPTLFNAGTPHPQLSSCYLVGMEGDSIEGIYNTLKDCAQISKWAGGIGLHIHNIRATGTSIVGTNGTSNGIVPMLKVFNSTARYVDQGGGKRNGSFAIYLEPWHADIEIFLDLKKNHGDEELRARDLFYALWIPDLFMEKVKADADWHLFCPHKCPGLADCYGDAFNQLYNTYVQAGKANAVLKARQLWFKILDSQMETGTPYLLYKDAANKKSNQQNLGVIKSSNLCVAPETMILTDTGFLEIQTLEGKTVNVWNGEEFSETVVHKTGVNQELITIETSDGCTLDCTPYHKFYIQTDSDTDTDKITIEASNLLPGDKLISSKYPIINGITLYQNDIKIVPVNASLKNKIEWLSNYYNQELFNSIIIQDTLYLSNKERDIIFNIKLMLQTCGIQAEMELNNNKHTLAVKPSDFYQLIQLGFKSLRVNLHEGASAMGASAICETNTTSTTGATSAMGASVTGTNTTITIKNIIKNGRNADTYCFNEPKKHAGIFNGIITSQCTEILEYSDKDETAVCNLASISLSKFVNADKIFDYAKLHQVTKVVTANLNKIIDVNFYPTPKTQVSNLLHRPIGIGVQGLADAFALMDIPYHSTAAKVVNKMIFETLYHASLECSNELARERTEAMQQIQAYRTAGSDNGYETLFGAGCRFEKTQKEYLSSREYLKFTDYALSDLVDRLKPIPNELENLVPAHLGAYSTFTNSPAAKGQLQFDLWSVEPSERYDWHGLKSAIQQYGLRNSLLVAPMPTASTSQILGNNECFEPFTSNIYSRRTNAGEFVLVNKYLMAELNKLGLWNEDIKNNIILNKGSIQQIECIPWHVREKYKIVWEIPMKHMIDMAADRGAYICQSQSLNLWLEDPDYKTLTSMHFYAWEKGLKTGIYYLRRKAKHQAQQFTIVPSKKRPGEDLELELECEMCSA